IGSRLAADALRGPERGASSNHRPSCSWPRPVSGCRAGWEHEGMTLSTTTVKRRKTQAERREQAESRMLEVAIRLAAQGYEDFTLAEVGEAAGYSRGLPAHYFGHKEDLVAKAVQHAIDQYQMALAQLPPSEPGLPRLAAIVRNYARLTNSKGNRARQLRLE